MTTAFTSLLTSTTTTTSFLQTSWSSSSSLSKLQSRSSVKYKSRRAVVIKATTTSTPATPSSSDTSSFDFDQFVSFIYDAQQSICNQLEQIDGKETFSIDDWTNENGKGRTRVLQNGKIYEKAGVNVSVLNGILSKERAQAMTQRGQLICEGSEYKAASLSLVLHSESPFIPTLRSDIRIFASSSQVYGGGGCDLTMFYLDPKSFIHFHKHWLTLCQQFNVDYHALKQTCDDYFYLPFRREYRGIGGIFYDNLSISNLFEFQQAVCRNFIPSYLHIIKKYQNSPFSEEQKKWQRIRRARYLEFNLLNDRGIKFGLSKNMSPSRFDSIMISSPPSVLFPYNYQPTPGSEEEKVIHLLTNKPINWVDAQHLEE